MQQAVKSAAGGLDFSIYLLYNTVSVSRAEGIVSDIEHLPVQTVPSDLFFRRKQKKRRQ
jgi:hypothetical protein